MYSTKKVREAHGFSQQEIAQIIGVHRSHVLRHEIGQVRLSGDGMETFQRILLLTDLLPDPDSLPDTETPYLVEALRKEWDRRLLKLEHLLAQSQRKLGELREANNRIKFKLNLLSLLMAEWTHTESARWKAMELLALGLLQRLKACGPERQLKLKLHIEMLIAEQELIKKYHSLLNTHN